MTRLLAIPVVLFAFHSSIQPLSAPLQAELKGRFWHTGCPVSLSQLRVLTVALDEQQVDHLLEGRELDVDAETQGWTSD